MPIVPLFLLKLSIGLAVIWGFYRVVLRRLTFYSLNRWYLLGYTFLSFIIPLINIGPMLPDGPEGVLLQYIPAIGGSSRAAVAVASHPAALSMWAMVMWVLALGAAVLLARMAVRWVSLVRLRRKARLIEANGVRIYQVDGPIIPFSFGNAIYINLQLYTEKEWADIVLHEYVHVRQKHTIDILLAEVVCILNWYNPFAWLIRYSIRQNLEFVADQQVLDKGADRKGYQYHLLKVVGEPRYRLANNFNFSSLKARVVMMNKMRSAKVHLLKLLFLLPMVGVLLVAFRDRYPGLSGAHGPAYVNAAGARFNSDGMERAAGRSRVQQAGAGVTDTVPGRKDSLRSAVRGGGKEPLYVIDGQIAPKDSLKTLNPGWIESIKVLKDSIAKATYGEKGKNGVVLITLKPRDGLNAAPHGAKDSLSGRKADGN